MKKIFVLVMVAVCCGVANAQIVTPGGGSSLSILKGTYTDGYLCKYTATGTLLDCNVNPSTYQTAISFGTGVETALGIAPNTSGGFLTTGNAAVTLSPLTGYVIGSGGDTVAATDSIIGAIQKLAGNYNTSFPACTPGSGDCAVNVTPNSAALACASGYACFGTGATGVLPYFKTAGGTSYQLATLDGPEALTNKSISGTTGTFTGNLVGLTPAIIVTKPSGTSTDVPSETVLTHADDGSASNAYVGMTLYNITDGVSGTVTASTSTTITVAAGSMSWANTDVYQLGPGPAQSGSIFYVGAAGTLRHPATVGYLAGYYQTTTGVLIINPASDSMVITNATASAIDAGDAIDGPATAGSFIWLHNASATLAYALGKNGTYTDGGAD